MLIARCADTSPRPPSEARVSRPPPSRPALSCLPPASREIRQGRLGLAHFNPFTLASSCPTGQDGLEIRCIIPRRPDQSRAPVHFPTRAGSSPGGRHFLPFEMLILFLLRQLSHFRAHLKFKSGSGRSPSPISCASAVPAGRSGFTRGRLAASPCVPGRGALGVPGRPPDQNAAACVCTWLEHLLSHFPATRPYSQARSVFCSSPALGSHPF